MTAGTGKLGVVVGDAVLTLDERFDGYRAAITSSLKRIIQAQTDTGTDSARASEVDRVIEALGERVRTDTGED